MKLPGDAAHAQFSAYSGRYSGGGVGVDDLIISPGDCYGKRETYCYFVTQGSILSFTKLPRDKIVLETNL